MSSSFGEKIRVSIFGQSHSAAIGVTIDGLPVGFRPDFEKIDAFMARRAPGKSEFATARKEADQYEILSGMADGVFCGAPFAAVIRNTSQRSSDYAPFRDTPRPGHADYTARVRYGNHQDASGGGHFSGRLTAPLCLAGAICMQILEEKGVKIGAHILQIGSAFDRRFDPMQPELGSVLPGVLPVLEASAAEEMAGVIREAKEEGDSVGGVIEVGVMGFPAGIGDPMFDGIENRIAQIVFGVPAVKGLEFGSGFDCASMRGSAHNDAYVLRSGRVETATNNHGGILGGISSGMPIVFRAAVKPTPSIFKPQRSVDLNTMTETELTIAGRHDPCIVPRAVPVMEAAAAIALADML
ncbi:MAG: chorismate synthase [Clostridia bacterium]|nr:chorismate synthase [Clostridia bacterium]